MKDLFQRHKSGDTARIAKSATPRLTLGAFGKHPGWDDHILGIGVETETLAQVKQALYVGGIGGQIDSGAWEKLEPEKRLAGYDHTFLWLRPGHVILGQVWSSTDGKGRAKYPMVLCIDGEAVAPGFMLTHLLPGLERLREACQATTSADQVTKDCRAAQEQLRAILSSADSRLALTPLSAEARRHFLDRPELGPDRLGFLRALHELGAEPNVRSRHLRLPLASDSRTESLLLWNAFFGCAVSDTTPLLLISRADVNWTDVLIGEPASDDFFCLQASNKAMPLATEIPYELAPDSKQRMQGLEARFLDVEPPPAAVAPTPSPKAQVPPAPAAHGSPDAATPAAKRTWPFFLIGGVVLAGLVAALWFSVGGGHSTATGPVITVASKQPAQQPQTNANKQANEQDQKYQAAMKEGQTAFDGKGYSIAIAKAHVALGIKSNDLPATRLKSEAQTQVNLVAKAKELDQKYQTAMKEGQTAFDGKDYTTAIAKADVALGIKPNDQPATRLKSEAQTQTNLVTKAREQDQKYQTAMKEGQTAFDGKDYTTAIAKAHVALGIKSNDQPATRLKSEAQSQVNLVAKAKELDQKYQTAMKEGQTAFDGKDYTTAIAKAEVALGIKKGDPGATRLKDQAKQGQDLASAQTFFDQWECSRALELCKKHVGIPPFDALAKSIGVEQNAFDDASSRFAKGDYSFIEQLKNQSYSGKKPFADLLDKAVEENRVLEELKALKQATNWTAVKTRLADVAFQSKPPFTDVAKWAETQRQIAPKQSLEKLDSDFEVMLVWFDLLDPAKAQSSEARTNAPIGGQILPKEADRCASKADYLESQFKKGGWLTPAREKNLKELKKAIRYH
jgi:hypothetical protein